MNMLCTIPCITVPSVTEKLLNMGCERVFDKTRTSPGKLQEILCQTYGYKSKSPIVYNDTDASNCKKNGLVGPDNANGDDRDNYAVVVLKCYCKIQ